MLVALSGSGLVGYEMISLVRNFTGFIELGLTPEHIGGTAVQIRSFSPDPMALGGGSTQRCVNACGYG